MASNQRRKKRNRASNSQNAKRNATRDHTEDPSAGAAHRRPSTETKSSLKTTELIVFVGAVLAVIMTALAVDDDGRGGRDPFGAESAIRCITYLTVGYLLARGFAKSGSHENRIEHDSDIDDDTASTGVVHDDERVHDDESVSEDDIVETSRPAARTAQPAASEDVDARPSASEQTAP